MEDDPLVLLLPPTVPGVPLFKLESVINGVPAPVCCAFGVTDPKPGTPTTDSSFGESTWIKSIDTLIEIVLMFFWLAFGIV